MAEYIEREALLYEIGKMAIVPDDLYDYGIIAGVDAVRKKVSDAHAADVAPVVHGRWIISSGGYYPYCSVCLKTPENGIMTNYCPECGARMDGDGNG